MEYEKSKYLNTVEYGQKHIICSGLTGAIAIVDDKELSNLNSLNFDEKTTRQMEELGFIIPKGFDEIEKAKSIFRNSISKTGVESVSLVLTYNCNLACSYCFEDCKNEYMSIETADEILDSLFERAKKNNAKKIKISFFGGEPLLNLKVIEHSVRRTHEFAEKNNMGEAYTITTNGTMFDEKLKKIFSKDTLGYCQITLDGDKEIHDVRRPSKDKKLSSFDMTYENVPKFMEIAQDVCIRINIDESNVDQIKEFIEERLSKFSGKNLLIDIGIVTNFSGRGEGYDTGSYETIASKLPNIVRTIMKLGLNGSKEVRFVRFSPRYCAATNAKPHWYDAKGRIYCCEREVGSEKNIGTMKDGIDPKKCEIWKSRTIINTDKCLNCSKLFFCGGSCPCDVSYGSSIEPACFIFDDLMRIYVDNIKGK